VKTKAVWKARKTGRIEADGKNVAIPTVMLTGDPGRKSKVVIPAHQAFNTAKELLRVLDDILEPEDERISVLA